MTTAKRFSIYPCSLVHAGGTLDLLQMQGFGIKPQPRVRRVYVGGAVDPKAHFIATADPVKPFQTRDLTTLFGTVSPLTGLRCSSGATFRLQERDNAESVFLSTATHETFTSTLGHLVVESLAAQQDDAEGAVAQCTYHALFDGTNAPIVHNTGVDFSLLTPPAFTSEFFMGPVYHNGSQVEGITGHQVDFGTRYTTFRTDGAVYPSNSYIARREPVIRITTLKSDIDAAVSQFVRAASGTLAVYFWKAADAGDRVAVGSGAHLKISAATSVFTDDTFSVSEHDDATATINILPKGSLAYSIVSTIP